ncbi:hypothetical protein FT638_08380 [Bacillus cereus]|nr:hypothetical protein [Bacillus cereus]
MKKCKFIQALSLFILLFVGSKTPASKFSGCKEGGERSTARKSPTGSTNIQRGMGNPPTE